MDTIMLHVKALRSIGKLPPEDAVTIINAMADLAEGGSPEVPAHLNFGWSLIRDDIMHDIQSYNAKCERNRQNAKRKWDATACDRMPSHTTACDTESRTTIQCNTIQPNTIQYNSGSDTPTNIPQPQPQQGTIPSYPETVDDILKTAKQWNIPISSEQADNYLSYRKRDGWQINRQNGHITQISPNRVGEDLKVWMARERRTNNNSIKENNRDGHNILNNDYGDANVPEDIVL